eukprot:1151808-Pelagomonas_calceolata.AAC.2
MACMPEPVFGVHKGFQSILEVWEVHLIGNGGGRFRKYLVLLLPEPAKHYCRRGCRLCQR